MIIGTVSFWQWEQRDGWGFIFPDGCTRDKANRIYFNSISARYSPVRPGDRVAVTLLDKTPQDMSKHRSCAAFKVEMIERENEKAATPETERSIA